MSGFRSTPPVDKSSVLNRTPHPLVTLTLLLYVSTRRITIRSLGLGMSHVSCVRSHTVFCSIVLCLVTLVSFLVRSNTLRSRVRLIPPQNPSLHPTYCSLQVRRHLTIIKDFSPSVSGYTFKSSLLALRIPCDYNRFWCCLEGVSGSQQIQFPLRTKCPHFVPVHVDHHNFIQNTDEKVFYRRKVVF